MYPPTVCRLNSQRAPLAPRIVEPPLCIGVSRKIVLAWLQELAAGTANIMGVSENRVYSQ